MSFAPVLAHGPITPVVDGVHLVRGTFRMGPGMLISRTMTIVSMPDGLVIMNAIRLNEAAEAELERMGKVKHLIKLSESHGIDEPYYAERFKPEVWATPGAKLKGAMRATQTLGPDSPIADALVIDFPGSRGWKEVGLWQPHAGGTLVTCDAVQHHIDTEQTSMLGRAMSSAMGFKGGVIVAPMWRKMQKVHGQAVHQAMSKVRELSFQNLITGHGPAVIGGAQPQVHVGIDRAATA